MATIDLSRMPIRTANEVIRGYGAVHRDIDIINPDARHYIAVGLTNPVNVRIHGSAGLDEMSKSGMPNRAATAGLMLAS